MEEPKAHLVGNLPLFLSPSTTKGLFPPGPAYWKGWDFHPGLGKRGGVQRLTSRSTVVSSEAGKD